MKPRCLFCGGTPLRFLYQLADQNDARIVSCDECDLVQLEKLPTSAELAALYSDGYFEEVGGNTGYEDYASQEKEYLATFRDDVRRILDFADKGSVLDIGCGYGYFIREALAAGLDAYGTDLSSEGIRVASKHAPDRVFRGAIDTIEELADRRFDVIFASHLIEHILDPRSLLDSLIPHMNDRGLLVLVTPNIESWLARISGRRWVSFKIPEHVAYYSPKTIERLLVSVGLDIVAIDSAYQYYRLPFLMSKIRKLLHPLGRVVPELEKSALLRDRIVRVTSGSLRVIARKPSRSE